MLKHLPPRGKLQLLQAYNDLWSRGSFPADWGTAIVVPIPKNTSRLKKPCDFRPISLLSCTGKILEKMVNLRLTTFLEENSFLDHRQFAFRRGKGAGTYLGSLGETMDTQLNRGNHIDIATLDISKAYNTVWREETLRQLVKWGITGNLGNFLKSFLDNRKFSVAIGGTLSSEFPEENGVPQGSILSVTLFLVFMNSVFAHLPKNACIFVYADDIVLLSSGTTPKSTRIRLQKAIDCVSEWANSVGFRISAEKSAISHVCRHTHDIFANPTSLHGTPIPTRKTITIIGVTIDRRLSFKTHFERIKQQCESRRRLIKIISMNHRVNNRRTIINVANSVITSKLLYGIELTGRNIQKLIEVLSPVYNVAIRNASGLLPSTPAISACVEAGVLTFDLVASITLINRTISFLDKTTGNHSYLFQIANRTANDIAGMDIPPIRKNHRVFARNWYDDGIKIDWGIKKRVKAGDPPAKVEAVFRQHCNVHYYDHKHLFTDGSKLEELVGIGIYSSVKEISYRLPEAYSIFSAEATAIYVAIIESLNHNSPTVIFSDSASVLAAIEGGQSLHTWVQAIEDSAPHNITLCWIPGHCGINGNEKADALANTGRQGDLYTQQTPVPDIKKRLKKQAQTLFETHWHNNRTSTLREVKNVTTPWTDVDKRRDQITLSRLRTGHTRLSHFSDADGRFRRTHCEICHIPKTVRHILTTCPTYHSLRIAHGLSNSMREILANDPTTESSLLEFLRESHLIKEI